ncbi:hypothetical protein QTP88_024378 [Uroleucon formosanum]
MICHRSRNGLRSEKPATPGRRQSAKLRTSVAFTSTAVLPVLPVYSSCINEYNNMYLKCASVPSYKINGTKYRIL